MHEYRLLNCQRSAPPPHKQLGHVHCHVKTCQPYASIEGTSSLTAHAHAPALDENSQYRERSNPNLCQTELIFLRVDAIKKVSCDRL